MKSGKCGLKPYLFAAVAAGVMIVSPAAAQGVERREYHLPPQDLAETLRIIGQTSGQEILFPAEVVRGKRAPRVEGEYTAEEAVRRALAATDLEVIIDAGAMLVRGRAQAAAVAQSEQGDADIVVTGSHIRGAESASPVVVATRSEIENAGLTDLGSYARTLSQNFSGGQNPGVAGGGNQGSNENTTSASTLNLRGLGPDATLTLVNGHRVAYDGVFQGVDISAIPVAAIERVEIVADGSSALYGSDAVGGVANIILRRDFEGLVTSARLGASTDGGNEQQQYNAVGGSRWTSGGILAAFDFSRSTAITARDRSYTSGLHDSASLLPRQKQYSVIVAGNQRITDDVMFRIDGQFNDRSTALSLPFSTTADVFTNGRYVTPVTTSYAITPSVEIALPGSWRASLSGTYADSEAKIQSTSYSSGRLSTDSRIRYGNVMKAVEIGGDGPLFSHPGGTVRLAVGGGYRSVGLDVNVMRLSSGTWQTTTDTSNSRGISFGYGELSVPLVGEANRAPWVYQLSVSGALRYESYHGVADVATPKFGLIYSLSPDISLKASWGKSFKAQTLYQEFQVRYGNLVPGAIFNGFPADRTVLYLGGGNSELKPERATTWTASVALHPRALAGLSIEVSYFNIQFRDRVVIPLTDDINAFVDPSNADIILRDPTAAQLADAAARLPQGITNATGAPYDPASIGAIIDGSLQNAAHQSAKGVDVAATYRFDINDSEHINLSASGSYLDSKQQLTAAKPILQRAGTLFDPPHWRGRLGASYEAPAVNLATYLNYIGSVQDTRYDPPELVDAFTSIDVIAKLRSRSDKGLTKNLDLSVAVLNLLNEKPARIRNSNPIDPPYDSTNYPAAGRVVSLTLTKSW